MSSACWEWIYASGTEVSEPMKQLDVSIELNGRQREVGVISGSNDYEYSDYPDGEDSEEEWDFLDFLNNPEYETVYEKHGWKHVKDFYPEFSELEKDCEYALLFKVPPEKARNSAFLNTILGMLLHDNPGRTASTGCNTFVSEDGQNHFWLLRRKQD